MKSEKVQKSLHDFLNPKNNLKEKFQKSNIFFEDLKNTNDEILNSNSFSQCLGILIDFLQQSNSLFKKEINNFNDKIYEILNKIQLLIKKSSPSTIQPSIINLCDLLTKLLRHLNLIKFRLLGFETLLLIINSQISEKQIQEKTLITFLDLFENSIYYAEFSQDHKGTFTHKQIQYENMKNSWVNFIEKPKELKPTSRESLEIIEVYIKQSFFNFLMINECNVLYFFNLMKIRWFPYFYSSLIVELQNEKYGYLSYCPIEVHVKSNRENL